MALKAASRTTGTVQIISLREIIGRSFQPKKRNISLLTYVVGGINHDIKKDIINGISTVKS